MKELILLAAKNLQRRSLRSFLTLLGIFLGIAAVIALVSLGEGLETAVTEQFANVGTDKLIITAQGTGFGPPGSTAVTPLTDDDVNLIRTVKGFKVVAKRILRTARMEFNDKQHFGFVVSSPKDDRERELVFDSVGLTVVEGRMLKSGDTFKGVVGHDYSDDDFFDKPVQLGKTIQVNGQDITVVGILKRTGNPQFNDVLLLPEDVLVDLLAVGEDVDAIIGQVQNPETIEQTAEQVRKVMRKQRDVKIGEEDFDVETPQQVLAGFNAILNIIQFIIIGIASMSLLVGGVGIANTMFTAVYERRKEIGVLKSLGARNKDVLLLFLFESGILGLIGGFLGIVIGVAGSYSVSQAARSFFGENVLAVQFSLPIILGTLAFAFIIGVVSGILPAKQAADLTPVEALRK